MDPLFVWKSLTSAFNSREEEATQQDELSHDCDDVRMNSSGAVADGVWGFSERLNEFGKSLAANEATMFLSLRHVKSQCVYDVKVWLITRRGLSSLQRAGRVSSAHPANVSHF